MTFEQIEAMAAGSTVTEHSISTATRAVSLPADSRFRILYFFEADCMLEMNTSLLSLEADCLTLIPPGTPAVLKLGSACRYWQLAFHGDGETAILRDMFYRRAMAVQLGGKNEGLHLFFPQLRALEEAKRLRGDEAVLCHGMAFGTLLYNCAAVLEKSLDFKNTVKPSLAQKLHSYLDEYYTQPLSLEQLESVFFVSRHHICRQFAAAYGMTVMEYVRQLRCEKAGELLLTGNMPISDIGRACGFSTVQSFHSAFSRLSGCTPLQYRKNGGTGR